MDRKTMRNLGLSLLFTAMSYGGLKAETKEPVQKDHDIAFYFPPERLIKAVSDANASVAEANAFCQYYLQYMDEECRVNAETLLICARQAGMSSEQTKQMFNSLAKEHKPSTHGYSHGNYNLLYTISETGQLSRLDYKADFKMNEADIKEIHEARCRHCKLPVDSDKEKFISQNLLIEFLVYQDVQQKLTSPKPVSHGKQYLKNFEQKLVDNGINIGKDGKLHGVESSKDKHLYTNNELGQEYNAKRAKAYHDYISNKGRL